MATPEQQLFESAEAGDAPRVAALIAAGADVCAPGEGGATPLMAAAEAGSPECVAALLQAGAPWNALDDDGYCAGERPSPPTHRRQLALSCTRGDVHHCTSTAAAGQAPCKARAPLAGALCYPTRRDPRRPHARERRPRARRPGPAGDYANASKNADVIEMLLNWGVQCEQLLGAMERWASARARFCVCVCVCACVCVCVPEARAVSQLWIDAMQLHVTRWHLPWGRCRAGGRGRRAGRPSAVQSTAPQRLQHGGGIRAQLAEGVRGRMSHCSCQQPGARRRAAGPPRGATRMQPSTGFMAVRAGQPPRASPLAPC
jgi:hypothetical protein